MPIIATALVGLLFLPGAVSAPIAEAQTTPQTATTTEGDDPSPSKAAPAQAAAATYTVRLTGYNAVASQTDGDPRITASGVPTNPEVIAARSQDLGGQLPFGTVIEITREGADTPNCGYHKVAPQIGYRVIADSMNARWTKRIDVQLDQTDTVTVDGRKMNPASALGLCSGVKIRVVGHIPLSQIPDTQEELAYLFGPHNLALK